MTTISPLPPATETWRNWSGSVVAHPSEIARPVSEAALAELLGRSAAVRVVGAGHSFTPLCETDGTLVCLADIAGELRVAPDRSTATVPAGWSLRRLTEALWAQGLSLANQGDIDAQAVAGALATGTHGTGAELGSLSTQARRFRLMLASGEVVTCDAQTRPDLFEAQRLSLGLLGVALEIKLTVLPAYHLEERIEKRPFEEVAEGFAGWAAESRHAEFFVFPYAERALVKTLNVAADEGSFRPPGPVDETVFRLSCELSSAAKSWTPTLQKLLTRGAGKSRRVGPAWQIFASERTIPFEEMEYELPREAAFPALQAVIAWIRARELPIAFPFEFRWTAGDDIWLSPFNDGPRASVSMHQFASMPWRESFAEAEAIFRDHGGKPHWGKRHTLTRDDLDALYPQAERFRAVRRAHDSEGKLLNAHLSELFE